MFDTAVNALLKQGKKAWFNRGECEANPEYEGCAYLDPHGNRCAIGHCIAEVYVPEIEGMYVTAEKVTAIIKKAGYDVPDDFIGDLQESLHDHLDDLSELREVYPQFAAHWGLHTNNIVDTARMLE